MDFLGKRTERRMTYQQNQHEGLVAAQHCHHHYHHHHYHHHHHHHQHLFTDHSTLSAKHSAKHLIIIISFDHHLSSVR